MFSLCSCRQSRESRSDPFEPGIAGSPDTVGKQRQLIAFLCLSPKLLNR